MRSYTPTSSDDDIGHFDLLIKVRVFYYTASRSSYCRSSLTRRVTYLVISLSSNSEIKSKLKDPRVNSNTIPPCLANLV